MNSPSVIGCHKTILVGSYDGQPPSEEVIQDMISTLHQDEIHRAVVEDILASGEVDFYEAWPGQIKTNPVFSDEDYTDHNWRFETVLKPGRSEIKLFRAMPYLSTAVNGNPVANSQFSKPGLLRFAIKPKLGLEWDEPVVKVFPRLEERDGKKVRRVEFEISVEVDNYDWELAVMK